MESYRSTFSTFVAGGGRSHLITTNFNFCPKACIPYRSLRVHRSWSLTNELKRWENSKLFLSILCHVSQSVNAIMISPVPFNHVAKTVLAAQASSASSERMFSDLGKKGGNRCKSLVSETWEMAEVIRVFLQGKHRDGNRLP